PHTSSSLFPSDSATTDFYALSLHDALPILPPGQVDTGVVVAAGCGDQAACRTSSERVQDSAARRTVPAVVQVGQVRVKYGHEPLPANPLLTGDGGPDGDVVTALLADEAGRGPRLLPGLPFFSG